MGFKSQGISSSLPCPSCGSRTIIIVENRALKGRVKRRKHCTDCDHRFTTYEVYSDAYQQAQADASLRSLIAAHIGSSPGLTPVPEAPIPCRSCALATANSCSVGLPEFDTREAIGCGAYSNIQHHDSRYIA